MQQGHGKDFIALQELERKDPQNLKQEPAWGTLEVAYPDKCYDIVVRPNSDLDVAIIYNKQRFERVDTIEKSGDGTYTPLLHEIDRFKQLQPKNYNKHGYVSQIFRQKGSLNRYVHVITTHVKDGLWLMPLKPLDGSKLPSYGTLRDAFMKTEEGLRFEAEKKLFENLNEHDQEQHLDLIYGPGGIWVRNQAYRNSALAYQAAQHRYAKVPRGKQTISRVAHRGLQLEALFKGILEVELLMRRAQSGKPFTLVHILCGDLNTPVRMLDETCRIAYAQAYKELSNEDRRVLGQHYWPLVTFGDGGEFDVRTSNYNSLQNASKTLRQEGSDEPSEISPFKTAFAYDREHGTGGVTDPKLQAKIDAVLAHGKSVNLLEIRRNEGLYAEPGDQIDHIFCFGDPASVAFMRYPDVPIEEFLARAITHGIDKDAGKSFYSDHYAIGCIIGFQVPRGHRLQEQLADVYGKLNMLQARARKKSI